jgi:hypothetical protein
MLASVRGHSPPLINGMEEQILMDRSEAQAFLRLDLVWRGLINRL